MKAIREGSTKRVLTMLEDLANSEDAAQRDKYAAFWTDFGAVLKEGVGEDHANQERLAKLLRFASTHADSGVSFADYVGRMKEGQEAIYYITADTLAAAKSSPQLEIFRKKGIEVLLLVDRVDEWMLEPPLRVRRQAVAERGARRGRPRQAAGRGGEEAGRSGVRGLQAGARAPEGGAEGSREGRARDDAARRFTGLPGGRGGRHERPPRAPAEAGGAGGADVAAGARGQPRARARQAARRERAFRRPGATSCSTRRCWPKAGISTIRPRYVQRVNALLVG